ncbi:integrase, partial [Kibdelosporangium lantanae]
MRKSFNPNTRPSVDKANSEWLRKSTIQVRELGNPDTFRKLLTKLDRKLDGTRAASDTIRLRRTTLTNALDLAVEQKLLTENPMRAVKTKKHSSVLRQVDRRSVANLMQGRMLLVAVWLKSPRLLAFFALMYYAGLRPEEATNVRKECLALPAEGWGDINLEEATPEIGDEWTDSGTRHEARSLKHREDGVTRPVPSCPELTAILWWHIREFGTAPDGRLFPGQRN